VNKLGFVTMMSSRPVLLAAALLASASSLGPIAAHAQTGTPSAGQLVPPTLAPEVRSTPAGILLPAPPETGAPPGAEKVTLKVGDIAIEGGDPALAPETKAALEPIRGRTVTVAEIYAAVNAIERAYAEKGYFLTRVIVPPQTVKRGGSLRLVVVEGYVESVSGDTLPPAVRDRAVAIVSRVVNRHPLTLGAFERALLLAGDTAGLDLRTRLTVGEKPGGVRLVLEGGYRPLAFELSGDNSFSHPLGLWTATASGSLNSVLGFGEQIYVNLTGSPTHGFFDDDTPRRLAAAGFTLPIGLDGMIFNLEGAWSETKPLLDNPGDLRTETEYERLSARLSYPLIRNRTDTLLLRSALDIIREEETAPDFDATLYDDQIRALRLGADFSHAFAGGTLGSVGLTLSQGLDIFGSRDSSDATIDDPVSTLGARADFTKLEGQLRVLQPLPADFSVELTGRGQYSFGEPLYKSEQFSLGGPHLLSAYDAGDIFGDSGWLVRGEMRYDRAVEASGQRALLQPYLFASHGAVYVENAIAPQESSVAASALGVGTRITIAPTLAYPREVELGIEGARQLSDDLGEDGWRFNLYLASRY
jgi:hemolysin activation/secretion protein